MVINASGEVCESWSQELAEWSGELRAWVTRLDVALDLEPPELARRRLLEMRRAFKRGDCRTTMRRTSMSYQHSDAEPAGSTLYLGGRTAELRIRAYDMRGPLRIEPQWRPSREMGERVPELLLTRGAVHIWRGLARSVEFPMPWYRRLLDGPAAEIGHATRTRSALDEVIEAIQHQQGVTLWALRTVGIDLTDLQRDPGSLRGSQAAKLLDWATAADKLGYDGAALRREVHRRWRHSK